MNNMQLKYKAFNNEKYEINSIKITQFILENL